MFEKYLSFRERQDRISYETVIAENNESYELLKR